VLAAGVKGTEAERLLGRGDFILVAGGEVVRFQAAYVAAEEIGVMVEMLQEETAGGNSKVEAKEEAEPKKEGRVIPFPVKWVERVARVLAR